MNKKQEMNKLLFKEIKTLLLSALALLVVGASIYYFYNKSEEKKLETTMESTPLIRNFNHKLGPDDAKVKLVEFYDPECESCAAFYPHVKQVMQKYQGKVQLITRYALYHGNSVLAAKASEAAAIQNKYWEYQGILFMAQKEWSHSQMPATHFFLQYAKELSLDVEKFQTDMDDLNRVGLINIDIEDGKKLGVNGTPTFFINGKKLMNFSPEGLFEAIENELKN